jgi:PAS domain-containing protein
MMDRKLSPLKIVILYAVSGLLWILFSDLLLSKITKDPQIYTKISIVKGWLYVILTAALLYWLVGMYSKQRTQSEIALRENEQMFRSFFEAHSSVMILIDPDTGDIVDANRAAADFYGFSRETLRSMAISDINVLSPE